MKKILQFARNRFLLILIALLALALIFVFVVLLKPDWFRFQPSFGENVTTLAMILTALATLVLAYATFGIIKSDREKENRDRKERLLNEIIEWAEAIILSGFDPEGPKHRPASSVEEHLRLSALELGRKLDPSEAKSQYMSDISSVFFKQDKGLQDSVMKVGRLLAQHINLLQSVFKGEVSLKAGEIGKDRELLDQCARDTIREAVRVMDMRLK